MRLAWEWVVPIIVMIFYVIGHVVKAREEAEAKANPKPAAPRGQTELDRFLEEIERLRRERAGMSQKEFEAQQEDLEEEERPAVRPVIVQSPPIVLREPVLAQVRREPAAPLAAVPAPPRKPADRLAPVAPAPPVRRGQSLAATMALLRNPQSVVNAIILHEILGPPKSRQ